MKNSIKISILMAIAIISNSNLSAATLTWDGSSSTDWSTAANWSLNRVPNAADNVIIPSGLSRYPVLTANANVDNFTLNGGSFSTSNFNLTVDYNLIVNNGTFDAGTGTISADNVDVNNGTLTIQGNNLTLGNDFSIDGGTVQVTGNDFDIDDDFNFLSGTLDLNGYDMDISDRYTYEGGSFVDAGSLITAVYVTWNFSGFTHILPTNLYVTTSMAFTSGVVVSSASSLVSFDYNASVSGVSDSSHINGPVRKEMSSTNSMSAFNFPIGNGNVYAPIGITNYGSRRDDDYFTAQYFSSRNPNAGGSKANTLNLVSQAEYWILDRGASSGTATTTATVRLSYNTGRSGSITNASLLRVAKWNGTQWVDEGRSSTNNTGNNTSGTLSSSSNVSSFSPFTLGSSTNVNPLPVKLLDFNAAALASNVNVKWTTTSEINNDYFNVEKSLDGKNWSVIGTVKGAGNTEALTNYNFVDANPVMGMQYYRLQQNDINGEFTYSSIAPVKFSATVSSTLNIFPMPADNFINVELPGVSEMSITIYNANGQKLYEATSGNLQTIDIQDFNAGLYIIEVKADNNVVRSKFLKN